MPSKTPLFDAALDAYYRDKAPGTFVCRETGETFEVTPEEFAMYQYLRVPLPTVAPWVRLRRHRASIAGVDLFRRVSADGSSLISMYDPESPTKIFPSKDEWDPEKYRPMDFGTTVDASRSFFEQWLPFSLAVPRPAIAQDPTGENSEWSVYSIQPKNCYFSYGGMNTQDSNYCDQSSNSRDCTDVWMGLNVERCYEAVQCTDGARLFFSERCAGSMDLWMCYACVGCRDCFGCANLNHKQFCFLNEQLTEAEYRRRMSEIDFKDARVVEEWRVRVGRDVWDRALHCAGTNPKSERVAGDNLVNCKDVSGVYAVESEHVYNLFSGGWSKDCADVSSCPFSERDVNSIYAFNGQDNKMSNAVGYCIDVEYSELLATCEHCFGCIGLKHMKFCVFNKQYTEEAYWPLVDAIKTAMLERGEYGEYFPYDHSAFAYNTSHANLFFPLDRQGAEKLGARWYGFDQERSSSALSIDELPYRLEETIDDVLSRSFRCPISGRVFRIVKPELEFHRSVGIALPRIHPSERRKQRAQQNFSVRLYDRACERCGVSVKTRIPSSSPCPLVCEDCYAKAVSNDEALRSNT